MCMCVCLCGSVCMCGSLCVCACACACVPDRQRNWVFTSTALVVASTTMRLTSYSDYLTGFREPLSAPYRSQTGLKNV